jgi:hypothetical protein
LGESVENPGWRKSSYSGNGGGSCVEVGAWRKSSHSGNGGSGCVEVDSAATGVLVRDTTNRAGAVLTITTGAWRALIGKLHA